MNELGALVMAHIPALVMMIVGYVLLRFLMMALRTDQTQKS